MKYFISLILVSCFMAIADEYRLQNDYLRLEVDSKGGRIVRLALVSNDVDLTDSDGLLGDDFWNIPESQLFLNQFEYDSVLIENTLAMRVHQTGGGIDFLELQKTIRLVEAMLEVDYRFVNLPAAMATREYGFRSRNFTGKAGGKRKLWFFPLINGIRSENGSGVKFSYYKRPSRGWFAFADSDGNGLAMTMDYRTLDQFYGWFGKPATTQEFFLDRQSIPSGEKASTRITLIPFQGIARVSGAGGGLVGSLTVTPDSGPVRSRKISARIYSARRQNLDFELSLRRLRGGQEKSIASRKISFTAPGQIQDMEFTHKFPDSPGLYEFELVAVDGDGKKLAIFNAPAGMHTDTLSYRMKPEFSRPQRETPEIDLRQFDFSLKTPHIPWAHPLAGGKIKLLAVTPLPALAELGELAQRIDIELHTLLWPSPARPQNSSGKYFGLLTSEDISDNLDKLLQDQYDVILLAGLDCSELSIAQRDSICRKVNEGCGIVEIGNRGGEDFLTMISAINKGKSIDSQVLPLVTDVTVLCSLFRSNCCPNPRPSILVLPGVKSSPRQRTTLSLLCVKLAKGVVYLQPG